MSDHPSKVHEEKIYLLKNILPIQKPINMYQNFRNYIKDLQFIFHTHYYLSIHCLQKREGNRLKDLFSLDLHHKYFEYITLLRSKHFCLKTP